MSPAVYLCSIPKKNGERGGEEIFVKNTMSTFQRNWIVNLFEMKSGELNWIVNWMEMKDWWLNWIVNWVLMRCASQIIEFELNPNTWSESELGRESKKAESQHLWPPSNIFHFHNMKNSTMHSKGQRNNFISNTKLHFDITLDIARVEEKFCIH